MLGLDEPDFGQLLSGMVYRNGDTIKLDSLIQPRAEGEVAFVAEARLGRARADCDRRAAGHRLRRSCFEIVDSRIDNWDIKVVDTIADNASCGVFVLGTEPQGSARGGSCARRHDDRRATTGETVGELFGTGAGAAVKGSPVNSLLWLANTLGALGMTCRAGEVILTGSLTLMAWLKEPQTITCEFGGLGQLQRDVRVGGIPRGTFRIRDLRVGDDRRRRPAQRDRHRQAHRRPARHGPG